MFGNLTQKNRKNFSIRDAVATVVRSFFTQRESEGSVDEIWTEFKKRSRTEGLSLKKQNKDLIRTFSKDIQRSYTQLTAGTLTVFNYTSLRGVNKSYFVLVVGAFGNNGVYNNTNKKTLRTNTLMSCFLINEATNLNTLATVVNVLLEQKIDKMWKKYKPLTNDNEQDNFIEQQARALNPDIDEDGLKALFPTTEFRTFRLNTGMKTMYKVDINGS
jgi:hypothetical protein